MNSEDARVPESIRGSALDSLLGAVRSRLNQSLRIIEIGTACGYSAIRIAQLDDRIKIVTIELNAERSLAAHENIKKAGLSERIELVNADACEYLKQLDDDSFDIAFLDGPKAQYSKHFLELKRIVVNEGLILIDNVNFDRNDKKYKTINKRMALFREELAELGAAVDMESGFAEVRNIKNSAQRVELLAPAGDLEKLRYAVVYGADAVYIGGEFFGLRSAAKNFSRNEMAQGIEFAHSKGCKVYLAMNIVPHEGDIEALPAYLDEIADLEIDAFIVSDPGTMLEIKKKIPGAEIHLSTQANTTNSASAEFWRSFGVSRIVLARELSFEEISAITRRTKDMEFEVFVHGAMCISHSGRCMLSNYLTGRDSNRGDCAQPCRWSYSLHEQNREGEYFPIEQDNTGTYIMNSRDLCMIEHIPELIGSGVCSLKIEGRMKTPYYVASVVRVYREALDRYFASPEKYVYDPKWLEELKKTSNRGFTTGFYERKADASAQNYESAAYSREYDFVGVVISYDEKSGLAEVEQRNNFAVGAKIEVIGPDYFSMSFVVDEMYDGEMNPIDVARHAQMKLYIKVNEPLKPYYILRTQKKPL